MRSPFAALVILANSTTSPLPAQESRIGFEHLSIEQGLSQSEVNCIVQDREGFIWFGTQDGLNRYDGYTFTVYRHSPSDSASISDNYITALFEDRYGTLWIGTQNGLNRFNREKENFQPYLHSASLPGTLSNNFVSSICSDSGPSVLVGTFGGGLNRLEIADGRFSRVQYDSSRSGGADTIRAVYRDRSGTVWVGTQSDGLVALNRGGDILSRYRHEPADESSLSQSIVQCITEDRPGNLWVGTDRGLNRLNRRTGRFRHYPFGEGERSEYANYIFCIYEDQSGLLWVGTDENLELYDPATDTFLKFKSRPGDPEALSDDVIMSIYDAGGVVWFGTKKGLSKYCRFRKKFQNYRHVPNDPNSLSDNKVWSIYSDRRGILWVGSNGGLDGIDRRSGRVLHYRHDPSNPSSLANNSVMAIAEDESGMMWLGTWGGGLNRFDRNSGTFRQFGRRIGDSYSSRSQTVVSLAAGRDHRLWLGTSGGLAVFDPETERFQTPDELPLCVSTLFHDLMRVIKAGSGDRVWLGMSQGLVTLDLKRGDCTLFRHQAGDPATLSDDRVLSLEESRDGKLCVGTQEGLNLLDESTGRCVRFTVSDGLPNGIICGILEDGSGNLWISSNKGISMLNPATGRIRSYDMADGLQSNEFNQWASYRSASGEMFFGGIDGLTGFFPDSLRDNPRVPPVVMTSLNIGGKKVGVGRFSSDTAALPVSYNDNNFSFEFAALDYTKPEKNQYAYMLEGFDKEWIYSGTRRYAGYTNLDPGRYVLHLKGSNNDGIWNERGVSLRFRIVPPFWLTWWFRAGGLLCLFSIAAAGYLSRLRSVRKRNAQLSNTVSSLEQQVAARELAERNLLAYQEKLRSFASDLSMTEERERRRLSAYLHDSIGQTLAFCKIKLGSVQRSARLSGSDERLGELLAMIEQSISDTRRLTLELSPPILHELGFSAAVDWLCNRMAKQHGIHFSIEDEAHPLGLDADISILLFHAVREVIVNIVKHAEAEHATIRIRRRSQCISVEVEDDGCGFDASALQDHARRSDGFGLFNIRERLHSLGGVLEIVSVPGSGTRVLLTVPLRSHAERETGS